MIDKHGEEYPDALNPWAQHIGKGAPYVVSMIGRLRAYVPYLAYWDTETGRIVLALPMTQTGDEGLIAVYNRFESYPVAPYPASDFGRRFVSPSNIQLTFAPGVVEAAQRHLNRVLLNVHGDHRLYQRARRGD